MKSRIVKVLTVDGLANFISSANSLINRLKGHKTMDIFTSEEAYYITLNGDKILPKISVNAALAYERYSIEVNKRSIFTIFIFKCAFILIGMFQLIGIALISGSLRK